MRSKIKQHVSSFFFLAALIVLGLSFEPTAQAISSGQRDTDFGVVSTSSSSYVIVPNSVVTVPAFSGVSRECVVQFSTEVGGSLGDRTDIAYAVDSTNPSACFPRGAERFNIGNGSSLANLSSLETRTNIVVIPLGAGAQHTIRPCFRAIDLSGGGKISFLGFRTLTVECTTN